MIPKNSHTAKSLDKPTTTNSFEILGKSNNIASGSSSIMRDCSIEKIENHYHISTSENKEAEKFYNENEHELIAYIKNSQCGEVLRLRKENKTHVIDYSDIIKEVYPILLHKLSLYMDNREEREKCLDLLFKLRNTIK